MSRLVLTRKPGQAIRIGEEIRITATLSSSNQIRLAIEAPSDVAVHREEVIERIIEANRQAAYQVNEALEAFDQNPQPEVSTS